MTSHILVPAASHEEWRKLLAQPDRHWKQGFSAMSLARAWHEGNGFFPEIHAMFVDSTNPDLQSVQPLLTIPEYQVPLPGGERASQTDVFVLAKTATGLMTIAVEGKVEEPFGPTISERRQNPSSGAVTRIEYLLRCLDLSEMPGTCRYQLLHRTVSAVLTAQMFFAKTAVMLVHSFSPTDRWYDDFAAFAELFQVHPQIGRLLSVGKRGGVDLYIGWCKGDQRFRGI